MCQITRSEDEMAAAEVLLTLAGFWGRVQRNVETTMKIPIASAIVSKSIPIIIASTVQPGKRHHRLLSDESQSHRTLSVDRNCDVKGINKSSSSSKKQVSTPKVLKITSPTQYPLKSTSDRVLKRTKRIILKSNEEKQSLIPVKPTSPVKKVAKTVVEVKKPAKGKKPIGEKNVLKTSEEIHPAKKMKISAAPVQKTIDVLNSKATKEKFVDIFSENVGTLIQSECVRHSRLFESAFELQHCKKFDTMVDFQYRAAENLEQYKTIVEEKRNEALSNRSTLMNKWMKKFRTIKNRDEICKDFTSHFIPTASNQWKAFAVDSSRSSDILKYKSLQSMRKPLIENLADEYAKRSLTKEESRSKLIEILKLLPNRPEVRHEFINVHLPRLVAAKKAINRKNNRYSLKKETEVNLAFQTYF